MMKRGPSNAVSLERIVEIAERIESAGLCMEIDALLNNHGYEEANDVAESKIILLDLPPSNQLLSFFKNCHEDGNLK